MFISKRILITGGSGFLGHRLKIFLEKKGNFVESASFDILDTAKIESELSKGWDIIFHFAGISHIPTCESDVKRSFEVNMLGTALLIRSIRHHTPNSVLIFASSAYVYDTSKLPDSSDFLIDETFPVLDKNVYGTTKLQSEVIIKQANESWGLKAIILRIFNHTHKSQSPLFFLPSVYNQIISAIENRESFIKVGNVNLIRDIGSIEDFQNAIFAICEGLHRFNSLELFNVCSGNGKQLSELLKILCLRLNFNGEVIRDESLYRLGEKKYIVGSCQRLTQKTGWVPQINTEDKLIESFLS